MGSFSYNDTQFLLDGQPYKIFSGAMHYFRVLPQYWEDRLVKLRALGLNTLETYVAWNLHEPRPGEFHFETGLDLVRYIQLAGELGFKVLLRPGPYICSEWEFGGLPAWLLKDPGMRLRCAHPAFLQAVDRFFENLFPKITPLLITRGGPVIAMQVENEYGGYGNDQAYLQHLVNAFRHAGIDVLLFTSDGPTPEMLVSGSIPGVLKTVNFAIRPGEALSRLREYQPVGPLMVTEFWDGWFDHWGETHHTAARDMLGTGESVEDNLETILESGASFSLYMAHGGTNFGFMNGANGAPGPYQGTITSYDYAAPLSECGDPTPRYHAIREVISRYTPLTELALPAPLPKKAFGRLSLNESAPLFNHLDELSRSVQSPTPEPMEYLDQDYGFILYRTHLSGPRTSAPLLLYGLADRAQVFVDGSPAGILEREFPDGKLKIEVPPAGITLDILVENMGRINYGPDLLDRKGVRAVLHGQQLLFGWQIYQLPLDNPGSLAFSSLQTGPGPAFFRGRFEVDDPADTFLSLPGWTKGVAWVNGFNLGRYWARGPQQTLYVPAPLLQPGANELVVLELHPSRARQVEFLDHPLLD
jgi:beta-galactosidase